MDRSGNERRRVLFNIGFPTKVRLRSYSLIDATCRRMFSRGPIGKLSIQKVFFLCSTPGPYDG
ncbi:hypothetical protein ACVIGB_005357 [Bradyrhizobium sp. USDA 4341]